MRDALADATVAQIISVGRTPCGVNDPKLRDLVHADLFDLSPIENQLAECDACIFAIGTPSPGKSEADYTRITYDLTMAVARTLARLNPRMKFIYVSAEGADPGQTSRQMWARVRGRLETDLATLPFAGVYCFRPAFVVPEDGIRSRVTSYRILYKFAAPIANVVRRLWPRYSSSTREVGRALVTVARAGYDKPVLLSPDFRRAVAR